MLRDSTLALCIRALLYRLEENIQLLLGHDWYTEMESIDSVELVFRIIFGIRLDY